MDAMDMGPLNVCLFPDSISLEGNVPYWWV